MATPKLSAVTTGAARKIALSKDNKILVLEAQRKILIAREEAMKFAELGRASEHELSELISKIAKEENISPELYGFDSDSHEFVRKEKS